MHSWRATTSFYYPRVLLKKLADKCLYWVGELMVDHNNCHKTPIRSVVECQRSYWIHVLFFLWIYQGNRVILFNIKNIYIDRYLGCKRCIHKMWSYSSALGWYVWHLWKLQGADIQRSQLLHGTRCYRHQWSTPWYRNKLSSWHYYHILIQGWLLDAKWNKLQTL